MKQIIGYMKYDYMVMQSGMLLMIAVFGVVSVAFSMRTGTGAVAYMLFCGLILSGSAFGVTMQTVYFTALAPGTVPQKVMGRYLFCATCMIACCAVGLLSKCVVKFAAVLKIVEESGDSMKIPDLFLLLGVAFVFLALQNVLLYLLLPMLGAQFASIIRMLPGFIMFFAVMKAGEAGIVTAMQDNAWLAAGVSMGAGVLSLILAIFLSCLIIRNRDNV